MPKNNKKQQWEKAVEAADAAIQQLIDMQADYQEEYENMTDEDQGGDKGQVLSVIIDLELQSAMDTIAEARDAKLP
jgi:hypothetical protein